MDEKNEIAQALDWQALASATNEEIMALARWNEEMQRGPDDFNTTAEWAGGIECAH